MELEGILIPYSSMVSPRMVNSWVYPEWPVVGFIYRMIHSGVIPKRLIVERIYNGLIAIGGLHPKWSIYEVGSIQNGLYCGPPNICMYHLDVKTNTYSLLSAQRPIWVS